MATILLSAVGFVAGGSIGGTVLGLSAATVGRAIGATIGRSIDQRLLGGGSAAVETGKVDRFRLVGASEGAPMARVYGRMRVAGQVIWATRFQEDVTTTGGGKGAPPSPEVTTYSYSVSLAVALCEGVISHVGRVWADGVEVRPKDLNMRVYHGTDDQMPDPKISAVEGAQNVPAFRGTAYVVFDTLQLAQFGNRVPQFTFEVIRHSQQTDDDIADDLSQSVQAVAMIPGTGEYALAATKVSQDLGLGKTKVVNANTSSGKSDFETSVDSLVGELPKCRSTSLVVSWFGDDLRCGTCTIRPKVEAASKDAKQMAWRSGGITRSQAQTVPEFDGQAVYGGTPCDASVIEAIRALNTAGQEVMYYPFILMDQMADTTLPNPYDPSTRQPELPWRGRITSQIAPNINSSTDQTASITDEVAAFLGAAAAGDFSASGETINYSGPNDWGYRRFILHQAWLCKVAGKVSAFCIGSEMRGLTQLRDENGDFPAVEALRELAADVRSILGPDVKISYAADWSEYFGYHPQDGSGDVYFHLDPLWADEAIDFIGIDNYMPLSDWRDGQEHLDADWTSIYNVDYLKSNIAGGEGYDWYYHSPEARDAQIRTPITDGAYGEPWVFRYKDIRNWWSSDHHNRLGGTRHETPTAWIPESKPIWFTEIGCAAVNLGTNQPNAFVDVKSSESKLPYFSDGRRDDFIQMQYLKAMHEYWVDEGNNPISAATGVQLVDQQKSHVWAWDARSFPFFPNRNDLWSDGLNYFRGHWITGRSGARSLASVVTEICANAGVTKIDVSELYGSLRGYVISHTETARASLQPLMVAYGFDAVERNGVIVFKTRDGIARSTVNSHTLVVDQGADAVFETTRQPAAEVAGRVRFNFVQSDGNFETNSVAAISPDEDTRVISESEFPISLTRAEAKQIAERWLAETRIARDTASFALPPSVTDIRVGDTISVPAENCETTYRVDRVVQSAGREISATKVDAKIYENLDIVDAFIPMSQAPVDVPVAHFFLDLPLISGTEIAHAPHLAVTSVPWVGSAAVYDAAQDSNYALRAVLPKQSIIGETLTDFSSSTSGLWDTRSKVVVKLVSGSLSSITRAEVLAGANVAAIGTGAKDSWELVQFTNADLIAENTYELSGFLRGQKGTEHEAEQGLPAGGYFILMNATPTQIDLGVVSRNVDRHFRIGPSRQLYTDESYAHVIESFKGNGDRPYAPCFLRARQVSGDVHVTWIRRSRLGGDTWDVMDVPLGEDAELYQLSVVSNGTVLRDVLVDHSNWVYSAAMQLQDGVSGAVDVKVAQISAQYGAGRAAQVTVNV